MPKTKKIPQSIDDVNPVIYNKITQGMIPVKLVEADDQPRNLTPTERKSAQKYVAITEKYLEKNTLKPDFRARCLCTYWLNLSALFCDAYILFQKNKTHSHEIEAYKSSLDKRYEEMFSLISSFIDKSTKNTISLNTKNRIHPYISNYLKTFSQIPTLFAYVILTESPSQVDAAKKQLDIANERLEHVSEIFKKSAPILANDELMSAQFEQAKEVNVKTIKVLHDFICLPGISSDSFTQSATELTQFSKSDELTGQFEQINQISPVPIASSSSASGEENSLVLSDILSDTVIRIEFQKLIRHVDTSYFDQKNIETTHIREWLNNPARLEHLVEQLEHYIGKTFPELKKIKSRLMVEEETVLDMNTIKHDLDTYRRVTHILLYFFRQIYLNTQAGINSQLYPLTMLIWELRVPCLKIMHLMRKFELPNGESLWYKNIRSFYWSSFETIYPVLFKIILLLITNNPVPGFKEENTKSYQEALVGYLYLSLYFHYSQILNNVYTNEIGKAKISYKQAWLLLRTSITNSNKLAEYWGFPVDDVHTQFEELSQNLTRLDGITSLPLQESLKLVQKLHQMETAFDETLVTLAPRSDTNAIESDQPDVALNNLFARLQDCFSNGGTLLKALPVLEESLIPLLPYCFGADPGTNLVNALRLKSSLYLSIKHSDTTDVAQDLLVNHLTWYIYKIEKALKQWQHQSDLIEQPRVRQFLELLKQDTSNFVPYDEARYKKEFQSSFQTLSFTQALDRALDFSSSNLSVAELGAIIKLTAQSESALVLHDNVLAKLHHTVTNGLTSLSLKEAEKVYTVWNNCLPDSIHYINRMNNDPSLLSDFYHSVFYIKLDEVKLYYFNGLLAMAMWKLGEAGITLKKIERLLNPVQVYMASTETEQWRERIKNPYSIPALLAYTHNPLTSSAVCTEMMPPTQDNPDFNEQQMLRFQNAWRNLASVSENHLTPAAALHIFKTWRLHFKTLLTSQVARSLDLLQKRWKEHYNECKTGFQKPKSSAHASAASSSSKSEKPRLSQSKPETDSGKKTDDKTNVELLVETNKIIQIQQHNEHRLNALEKRKQRKLAKQKATNPDKPELSVPLSKEKLSETIFSDSDHSSTVTVLELISESKQRPAALPHNFDSYASATKGFIASQRNFPALSVSGKNLSDSMASSSTGSSGESASVRYTLNPEYKHPEAVQTILDTLTNEDEGYFALLGGGYVRDFLRNTQPNDADIFTNFPLDKIKNLIPGSQPSSNFPSLFHVKTQGETLEIDIKHMAGKTVHDIANQFDFTVNCFFINSKGELLVPLEEAHTDLENQVLKSIIPIDDSFKLDISRLWRMIRLSNQLGWLLDDTAKESIRQFSQRLCCFSIQQFIAHFDSCFTSNENLALKNLDTFLELGLLPCLVGANNPEYTVIDAERLAFCKEQLAKLFTTEERDRLINVFALFSLIHKAPSLADHQQQVIQWISSFESEQERDYVTDRIINCFKETLPPRITHYYNEFLSQKFNVHAAHFNPNSYSSHRFWGPAQEPTNSSQTYCAAGFRE